MNPQGNLYRGINPHLNSFLQSQGGGWEAFHASAIERLTSELDARLPANYYVLSEKSLQVATYEPSTGLMMGRTRRTTPDVSVYQTSPGESVARPGPSVNVPTLSLPVLETLTEEEYLTGVVIYRFEPGELPGQPVTRLEVLSPGNKPSGSHYPTYLTKRRETLESGLRLVEIDWLHETRPVIQRIPSYPDWESDAYPYTIVVNDPRPTLDQGKTDVYGFGVDELLPVINIPLADEDVIPLDFGLIYRQTFDSRRLFRLVVDYSAAPVRFETYSPADQQRIRQRMAEIAKPSI